MAIEILTPPGRIVWGHPMEKRIKTDPKTRKPILSKEGKEQDVWACGLAIPVANFAPVEQAIAQAAYQMYPQGNFKRDFAWKFKRENDLDEQNKPYREREGYAGFVVLTISTQAYCPMVYKFENGVYRQLTEKEIKCGDWVVAKLSIAAHEGGVYVNPVMMELIGYDKEIINRVAANPNEAFGGVQYQLPPGVSATPIGGAPAGYAPPASQYAPPASQYAPPAPQYAPPVPVGGGNGAPMGYAPPVPVGGGNGAPMGYAPQYAPPAPQYAPPAPAYDFVNNAGIPGLPTGR